MLATAVFGDLHFQGRDLRAENELLRLQHAVHRGAYLVPNRVVLGFDVE